MYSDSTSIHPSVPYNPGSSPLPQTLPQSPLCSPTLWSADQSQTLGALPRERVAGMREAESWRMSAHSMSSASQACAFLFSLPIFCKGLLGHRQLATPGVSGVWLWIWVGRWNSKFQESTRRQALPRCFPGVISSGWLFLGPFYR